LGKQRQQAAGIGAACSRRAAKWSGKGSFYPAGKPSSMQLKLKEDRQWMQRN
jgi:hypothetical protein